MDDMTRLAEYMAAVNAEKEAAEAIDKMVAPIIAAGELLKDWRHLKFKGRTPEGIDVSPIVGGKTINLNQEFPTLLDVYKAVEAWTQLAPKIEHAKSKVPSDQLQTLQKGLG